MRSVASFIIMTAVAFVAVRFVSSTEPHQPQSRHSAVRPLQTTQYIAVPRYSPAYQYGSTVRRPQSRLQRLLLDYLRAQVWLSLLSPRTTTLTTTSAATERTTTSTTPEPEPETCSGLSGVPAALQSWLKYEGCCYEAGDSADNIVNAADACQGVAQGVYLANQNARSAADREALFVDLLGLEGDVWLPLRDGGGNRFWVEDVNDRGTPITSAYVPEPGVTFAGDQSTAEASTYSGDDPNVLTYRTGSEATTLQMQYACEYCPPS